MRTSQTHTQGAIATPHIPPPLVVAGLTAAGLGVDHLLGTTAPSHPRRRVASCVIGTGGGAFIASAVLAMVRTGNSPNPRSPVRLLNKHGIYRISRNPIYLGMLCAQVAIGVARGSFATLGLTPVTVAILQSKVIGVEESYLEEAFGDEYREYRAHVARWFGIRRRSVAGDHSSR